MARPQRCSWIMEACTVKISSTFLTKSAVLPGITRMARSYGRYRWRERRRRPGRRQPDHPGTGIRDYDAEGRFVEVAWSDFEPGISGSLPQAIESSHAAARAALDRAFEHQPWNDPWAVVSW
jgi:hypothetical protein